MIITRRGLEVATAVLTGAFGAAILISSVSIGIGWTPRGVGPGTFPAIASGLIVAGSLYNLVRGVVRGGPALLDGPRLRRIGALFIPAVGFVALVPLLGLHAAAGVYMFYVLWRHRYPLWKAAAIGIAMPFVLYSVFDWTFQVQLLRGLLGSMVGY